MKKRVLFVIDSLACGGAEKSLVSLLSLLDYSKIEVSLMMIRRGGIFECYIPKEVNIIDFPTSSGIKSLFGRLLYSVSIRLNGIFHKSRHAAELKWATSHFSFPDLEPSFDVAIAYQQGIPTYFVAKKVRANKKIAWVNTDIAKAGYDRDFNWHFYQGYYNVITVSEALREMITEQGFSDLRNTGVVYDILNVDMINEMATGPVDMTFDGIRIVTAGRLTAPKNHILAIETARKLKDMDIGFHWWLVGGGSEEDNIRAKAKSLDVMDCITITGTTHNPYPYMRNADIYVQTSCFEGFCLTLSEARILHKPVVTTNFPAAYNQIKHGDNGLITEMNPQAMTDAIVSIIDSPDLKHRIIEGTKKGINTTAITEIEKVNSLILND